MPTSPVTITALPDAPSRADPANFATRADAFVAALADFVSDTNSVGSNVYANALEAAADAADAAADAQLAVNASSTAAASAGAALWVSGTAYALGAVVYSTVSSAAYRAIVAHTSTTDPSLDATNWVLAAPPAPQVLQAAGAATTAIAGGHYVMVGTVTQTLTLPASPTFGDFITVVIANGRVDTVIARNGELLQGLAENMTANSIYACFTLRYLGVATGWRIV